MYPIVEVTDAERAFGTMKDLPEWETIPKEFKNPMSDNKYVKLFSHLFHCGGEGVEMNLKKGVDGNKMMRWYQAHATSWGPKHEHKVAGIAYRFSQWIDDWWIKKESA